ncbi:MAG: DoxX family membrane protein [Chlamydiia bacterium]|nr:DoxX family membrane protein [Chlamydiia bacterium]
MKKPKKHLFFLRLVAGIIFVRFGILHFIQPENFINILKATKTPFVDFQANFVPSIEIVSGILLLLGLWARLGAVLGCIVMGVATYSTLQLMQLKPGMIPGGLKEIPNYPPIFIPIILFIFCLYILIFGAGAWSISKY